MDLTMQNQMHTLIQFQQRNKDRKKNQDLHIIRKVKNLNETQEKEEVKEECRGEEKIEQENPNLITLKHILK